MKKLFFKPWVLAAVLIVAYLAGVALGICAIGLYPIYFKQKPGFIEHSLVIGQEHLQGIEDELDMVKGSYIHILIYDADGNCVRIETKDEVRSNEFDAYLQRWLPDVLAGQETFAITGSIFSPSLSHIWLTSGVPIEDEGAIVGAVFQIQNLQNLPEAVYGYILYFTVCYWLCAFFLLQTRKKQHKLDEARQSYIANVTHSLKTPNASIKALAEALCDGVIKDPDKQKVYYGLILRESNLQNRMVQEILEISKLQSHGTDFKKSGVCAEALFTSITDKYAMLCDCTDVALHVSNDVMQLPELYTNAACIRQVVELLLDNAIKFVPTGGNVWIGASVNKNSATICVRDNGIGIAESDLPHIFERFYRCNRSDDCGGGSGLGLAIVKEIISGLKEKIWVESELGKGTAFYFTVALK